MKFPLEVVVRAWTAPEHRGRGRPWCDGRARTNAGCNDHVDIQLRLLLHPPERVGQSERRANPPQTTLRPAATGPNRAVRPAADAVGGRQMGHQDASTSAV